jgi:hypothetical protein
MGHAFDAWRRGFQWISCTIHLQHFLPGASQSAMLCGIPFPIRNRNLNSLQIEQSKWGGSGGVLGQVQRVSVRFADMASQQVSGEVGL